MTDIELQLQVEKHFDFLISEYGYRCVEESPNRVRFESSSMFVELVFDGNRSFELGLLVGKLVSEEVPFAIDEILRLRGAPEAASFSLVQVTTRDSLARWVAKLSKALRCYGSEFIDGDEFHLAALARQRQKEVHDYALARDLKSARAEAELAWNKSDYASVVRALKPLLSSLTESELKKLQLAERRMSRPLE